MATSCARRPLWWLIGSGFLLVLGLFLVIVAALAKTALYDAIVGGLYSARYIDNTFTTNSCSTILLGDITCPGQRFKGWNMNSEDRYNTCMRGSAPDSKSLSSAAKWCENGKGGCNKPISCKPGSKYTYYFFNVLNADEVVRGLPAEVKEMEPVTMIKSANKFAVDKDQWNRDGVAQWSETSTWSLLDDSQRDLLDQVIVVPNPAAFVTLPAMTGTNTRLTSENLMYMAGAAMLYKGIQDKVDKMVVPFAAALDNLFGGESAINYKTLVKDAYRDGSPILKLGNVFANHQNCQTLMSLVTMTGALPGNADFFTMLMCTDAYKGNVAITAFSKVLEMAHIRVAPEDGILFYEYEKNCRVVNDKPSYVCRQEAICPDASTRASCLAPSLSTSDADKLFELFNNLATDFETHKPSLIKFADSCQLSNGYTLAPVTLCRQVITQLQKAGHAALYSANPDSAAIAAAYGWTDKAVAATMIPYFFNGTIAQLMNYENKGLPPNPSTGSSMGLRWWTNTAESDVKTSLFTRQQVSSRFGDKGLNYYKFANGMEQSCAFDYRCMTQESFLADGKTCVANDLCRPNMAAGYDVGVIPGRFFGSKYGSAAFRAADVRKTMFVSDMFIQANFTRSASDAQWHQIKVDKWDLEQVGIRTEDCTAADPLDRGIDCIAPRGTINIGYNAIYAIGSTPLTAVLPIYSSFPHFKELTPDVARVNTYDPLDKLIIHQCDSCASSERDFKTHLWTDPETGVHVKGSLKIQLNVRVAASSASLSSLPGSQQTILTDGSVVLDQSTDVMIPVYWIDKFDSAEDYQRDTVAFIQSVPYYINVVFWVGLWVGLLFLAVGGFLLWKGLKIRKSANLSTMQLTATEEAVKVEEGQVFNEVTVEEPAPKN